jgi:hypothetical protein
MTKKQPVFVAAKTKLYLSGLFFSKFLSRFWAFRNMGSSKTQNFGR